MTFLMGVYTRTIQNICYRTFYRPDLCGTEGPESCLQQIITVRMQRACGAIVSLNVLRIAKSNFAQLGSRGAFLNDRQ